MIRTRSNMRRRLGRNARRALALLITLWVVVVLSVIAYTTLYEANLNVELTRQTRDRFYARMAARSGIARAMVDLRNDLRIDRFIAEEEAPVDAKGDPWASVGEDYTDVEMGRSFYTVRVIDEESLLPLNAQRGDAFELLAGVLGVRDEEEQHRIGAAILDYQDPDDSVRLENAEDGNEDEVYANLIVEDKRLRRDAAVTYRNKNDRFIQIDELLDVYAMTPDLFFGEKWDGDEDQRIRWRAPRYYRRMGDDVGDRPGFRDLVSVYNPGRLNINTARPEVLHALFSANDIGLRDGEDATNDVVSKRPETGRGSRVDNSKAFRTPVELREAGVDQQALSAASGLVVFGVTSSIFRIEAVGRSGGTTVRIRCIVRRDWDAFERDDSRGERSGRARSGRDADQRIEEPAIRVLSWTEE